MFHRFSRYKRRNNIKEVDIREFRNYFDYDKIDVKFV